MQKKLWKTFGTRGGQQPNKCARLDVCKSGVCGAGLNRNMEWGVGVRTYVERDCRKELHTVVTLSNSEGQTAGGTRKRQQRRALATTVTPEGAGRVGVTKKAEKLNKCQIQRAEQKYSLDIPTLRQQHSWKGHTWQWKTNQWGGVSG